MSAYTDIDKANVEFWDELCGSFAARSLGIADTSPASLARFDAWYFAFYPYLERHIEFEKVTGKRVLEVGLGYGTVSQRLAFEGADYTGLDIAAGPVSMVNHRLKSNDLPGEAWQGSILEAPCEDGSFDCVIAIGCFHHTGNLAGALTETRRILKSGGSAIVMVYNGNSYRRWMRYPHETFKQFMHDRNWGEEELVASSEARGAYDSNAAGTAAPATEFVSARRLKEYCAGFSSVKIYKENADPGRLNVLGPWVRRLALATVGPLAGLDLYTHLVK